MVLQMGVILEDIQVAKVIGPDNHLIVQVLDKVLKGSFQDILVTVQDKGAINQETLVAREDNLVVMEDILVIVEDSPAIVEDNLAIMEDTLAIMEGNLVIKEDILAIKEENLVIKGDILLAIVDKEVVDSQAKEGNLLFKMQGIQLDWDTDWLHRD